MSLTTVALEMVPPNTDRNLDERLAEARKVAEEALKNAKSDIDMAKAQSELAVMAAQIAALRKYRQKR